VSTTKEGARVARRRTRAVIATAAALGAAAALAAPAGAVVNGSHIVATLPESSTLELSGYSSGAHLTVNAKRNGVVIGTALTDVAPDGSAGVNPVACWQGSATPQLLPGDTIEVSGDGPTDTATVQDVNATSLEIDPVTGNILVHGYARAPGGGPLDAASFSASVQARITAPKGTSFSNGRRTLRAGATKFDGQIAYDGPGTTNWTATFPPKGDDAALAQNATNFEGAYLIGVSELTIGRLPVAAPGAGCPPIQRNGVTNFDRAAVNASNAGSPLVVSGVTQPDATSVSVTVTDANGATAGPVTVTPNGGVWKAPGIDVSGLADGALTAGASITTPAQTFNGSAGTILKDVVVPPAPVASPLPGAFSAAQSVSLGDDDSTATIHYTTVGTRPGAGSPAFGTTPILVDHSLTIRAVAVDAAGNVSPEASFAYTIGGAPAGGGSSLVQQIPLLLPLAPRQGVQGTASTARPAVRGLSVAVRRGHALRAAMRLGGGAGVVRFRVFRARHGRPSGRALVTAARLPAADGRYVVTLRGRALRRLRAGRYVLEARAGTSRAALGAAARVAFRLG
jgi:hypothetical protein